MKATSFWLDPVHAAGLEATGTTAFRVFSGPDCRIERFGRTALLSARSENGISPLATALEQWSLHARWRPGRLYKRLLVRAPGESDAPVLIGGDAGESPHEIVTESGLRFEVDFAGSYSPGLFCDQRGNRAFLRERAPARVLNTFAHTCAFSVAAAAAGAATVSVDISKSSLQRGRRNFELNGMDLSGHRFVAEDVPAYLARLSRRGEKFDAIILDPPTFGRGGGHRTFRVGRDFESLLRAALALAAPGAAILLSTNCASWTEADLRRLANQATDRKPHFQPLPQQPDFSGFPHSASLWMIPAF